LKNIIVKAIIASTIMFFFPETLLSRGRIVPNFSYIIPPKKVDLTEMIFDDDSFERNYSSKNEKTSKDAK